MNLLSLFSAGRRRAMTKDYANIVPGSMSKQRAERREQKRQMPYAGICIRWQAADGTLHRSRQSALLDDYMPKLVYVINQRDGTRRVFQR